MTFQQFHHALRILRNLEREDLEAAGVIDRGEHCRAEHMERQWLSFQADPFRWFIRADDERAHKLFALIEARAGGTRPRHATGEKTS